MVYQLTAFKYIAMFAIKKLESKLFIFYFLFFLEKFFLSLLKYFNYVTIRSKDSFIKFKRNIIRLMSRRTY